MESFYFIRRVDEKNGSLTKVVKDKTGHVEKMTEYTITNGVCSCPGFQYRHDCKHIKMLQEPTGRLFSEEEVRKQVQILISSFSKIFRHVFFPNNPFEYVGNLVSQVSLILSDPIVESSTVTKGAWVGLLNGTDLKVKLVVT